MTSIFRIEPIRVKTAEIPGELLRPGSMTNLFPGGTGPRVVYLDEQFDYPDLSRPTVDEERAKQIALWRPVRENGTMFAEHVVEDHYGSSLVRYVRDKTAEELGTNSSALFFERVYSEIFNEQLNLVIISTDVSPHTGFATHDFGCMK
ncbi:MAG: hypothetical protein QG623_69 [Patescibacteria group bacterium]|nr:hypothetical protein [Patescibacteria group bacterium]